MMNPVSIPPNTMGSIHRATVIPYMVNPLKMQKIPYMVDYNTLCSNKKEEKCDFFRTFQDKFLFYFIMN